MAIREVTEADVFAADMRDLLAAIREHTDATKRLVDELVRERQRATTGRRAAGKRAATIRASAGVGEPRSITAKAHNDAEALLRRMGAK